MREIALVEMCFDCTIAEVGGESETPPPEEWLEWLTAHEAVLVAPSGDAAEFSTETCGRCGDTLAGYRQQFVVLG